MPATASGTNDMVDELAVMQALILFARGKLSWKSNLSNLLCADQVSILPDEFHFKDLQTT